LNYPFKDIISQDIIDLLTDVFKNIDVQNINVTYNDLMMLHLNIIEYTKPFSKHDITIQHNWFLNNFDKIILSEMGGEYEYNELYNKIVREIESYKFLDFNWDGYEAKPLNHMLINKSISFLNLIKDKKLILPTPMAEPQNGGVSFFWNNYSKDFYIEVGIDSIDNYSYFFDIKKTNTLFGKDDVSLSVIDDRLLETIKLFDKRS